MNEKIQSVLNSLPHKPGIYIMKDADGTIFYVGKAILLYNRVRSYFQESTDLSPKNRSMVAKIDDIEFLVVQNEVEALVLESNYIKQYRPKYNVLLRDDKNYPYIKVSLTEDFPRVYRVRSFKRDGNRYFGPYTNSGAVDATLDVLNKLFAFRTCRYDASSWAPPRDGEPPANWKQKLLPRPCTQYYIHRCIAPCVAYASREEYDAVIQQVILFLEGKHDEVLKDLRKQMESCSRKSELRGCRTYPRSHQSCRAHSREAAHHLTRRDRTTRMSLRWPVAMMRRAPRFSSSATESWWVASTLFCKVRAKALPARYDIVSATVL